MVRFKSTHQAPIYFRSHLLLSSFYRCFFFLFTKRSLSSSGWQPRLAYSIPSSSWFALIISNILASVREFNAKLYYFHSVCCKISANWYTHFSVHLCVKFGSIAASQPPIHHISLTVKFNSFISTGHIVDDVSIEESARVAMWTLWSAPFTKPTAIKSLNLSSPWLWPRINVGLRRWKRCWPHNRRHSHLYFFEASDMYTYMWGQSFFSLCFFIFIYNPQSINRSMTEFQSI